MIKVVVDCACVCKYTTLKNGNNFLTPNFAINCISVPKMA